MISYVRIAMVLITISCVASLCVGCDGDNDSDLTTLPNSHDTETLKRSVISGYEFIEWSPPDTIQRIDTEFHPLDFKGDYWIGTGLDNDLYLFEVSTNQRKQITNDGLPKLEAVLSETYIAWMTWESEASHIYFYDRTTGEQRRITRERVPRKQLAIDGAKIVWADKRNEIESSHYHYDIYACDLDSTTEYLIAENLGAQVNPSIDGDRIVWQDNRNSSHLDDVKEGCGNCPENRFDIYVYDFQTQTAKPLVEDEWLKASPMVQGNRVVWESYRECQDGCTGYQSDLYLMELDTGQTRQLTQTDDPERHPVLSGDWLLWTVGSACDVIRIDADTGKEMLPETGVYIMNLTTFALQRLSDHKDPVAFMDGDEALIVNRCSAVSPAFIVGIPQ